MHVLIYSTTTTGTGILTVSLSSCFNMTTMAELVSLGVLVSAVALGGHARADDSLTIECDGSALLSDFMHVHALDLLYRNVSQMTVNEGRDVAVTRIATLNVGDSKGILSRSVATIRATLRDFDCATVSDLQCEMFGLVTSEGGAKHEHEKKAFRPKLLHGGSSPEEGDISITYTTDFVHVACSSQADPPNAEWAWQVLAPGETRFQPLSRKHRDVTQTKYQQCMPLSTSKVIYPIGGAGDITLSCRYGNRRLASVIIKGGPEMMNDETLGSMLTVSTIVLVYTHFILLPFLFSQWNNVFTYRIIRAHEDFFMRKMRTVISYALGFVFVIVCLTLCVIYWAHALASSYLTFSIMEFLFITGYATMRFLSNMDFTDTDQGRLKNARIVTSFGAVLTPIICWTIIRINGGICYTAIGMLEKHPARSAFLNKDLS